MQKESSVISVMLRYPDEILKHDIKPTDFASEFFAEALHVMRKLSAAGKAVDVLVVADGMNSDKALANLATLQKDSFGVVANLALYVTAVKDSAKKRGLKRALESALNSLNESTAHEVMGQVVSDISEMSQVDTTKVFDSQSMMKNTIEYLDEMFDQRSNGKIAGVPSGMEKLDGVLGGFHKSDFVVVGARPAMGKTAWALTCAINAARQGFKVGFVSTEMSVIQVGMRVTSLISNIAAHKMRDSSFSDDDWPLLTSATQLISKLPFHVLDQASCSVADIAVQARSWSLNGGLDIIFVDYLTRLKSDTRAENRVIAVSQIATDLKTLARDLNIPVVALAQLSREVTKRKGALPQMSDLRDSGVIEQEADQILMLYRPVVYDETANESEAQIIIEKNRHGDVATLMMEFQKETMRWHDPANDYE